METPEAPFKRRGVYALLIDDSAADRRLIEEMLKDVDGPAYLIDHARTAEEARKTLCAAPQKYDIVLLDQNLGDGYGLDLIRELSDTVPAPMLILSGVNNRDIDDDALNAGAADFLPKNELNPLVLDRTIRYAVERHRNEEALRQSYRDLEATNAKLMRTTAQLEATSTNIVKLTEHLAMAPDSSEISGIMIKDSKKNDEGATEACRVGIWHISPDGTTLDINSPMRHLLDLDRSINMKHEIFVRHFTGHDRKRASEELAVWCRGIMSSFEANMMTSQSDPVRHVAISGCPIHDNAGKTESIMITVVDITDRRKAENTILDLAQRDPLTGLHNRPMFIEMLSSAMANSDRNHTQLAVFYLDLDLFKEVNDSLGHQAGDRLLKLVSEKLGAAVRESDLVARLGGDEFAVALNNLHSPAGAAAVADSIIEALNEPCIIEGQPVRIATSIGIAMFSGGKQHPENLLKNADLALYRCKKEGGRKYQFFDAAMLEIVERRRQCQNDLIRTIDSGGFQLFYQPQIDLDEGTVTGLEALLRWDRPGKGLTGPAEFLAIAEESGLILAIGDWVMRAACQQAAALQKKHGLDLPVSVNLSPNQLRQPHLAERVAELLRETGCPPTSLEIEITESAIIDDLEASATVVAAIRQLGVRVALDDFGTGYSSLTIVKALAVDTLKIDGSFVRDICTDPVDAAIVGATIGLGRQIGIRTVAECIETPEQAELLRDMGCKEVQGYLYSRPLPVKSLLQWLNEHSTPLDTVIPTDHTGQFDVL